MMYEKKCSWCKQPMYLTVGQRVKFCSRNCAAAERESRFNTDDSGPKMPMLDKKNISEEGFVALVKAIVAQARDDVLLCSTETQTRKDAEQYFLSEDFAEMTNLDGWEILCKLWDKYDENQLKKEERKASVSRSI